MKQIFLLITLVSIGTGVDCQNEDKSQLPNQLYITNFQPLRFITPDSIYSFYKFVEPNGEFYFNSEFKEYAHTMEKIEVTVSKNKRISKRSELRFKYMPDIDTLYTQFISKGKEYYVSSPKNLMDDLKASYILRQLKENVIDNAHNNTLRLMEPLDEMNFSNYYRVYKIHFFTDSARLFYTLGRSFDYQGMQIIQKDSCAIRMKDIKIIEKQLSKIDTQKGECREPGNPCIFESNNNEEYKRFLISEICFSHHINRNEKKKLDPVVDIEILLEQYAMKYFNINHLSLQ